MPRNIPGSPRWLLRRRQLLKMALKATGYQINDFAASLDVSRHTVKKVMAGTQRSRRVARAAYEVIYHVYGHARARPYHVPLNGEIRAG